MKPASVLLCQGHNRSVLPDDPTGIRDGLNVHIAYRLVLLESLGPEEKSTSICQYGYDDRVDVC